MPHWLTTASFLVATTTTAGIAQVIWLRMPLSRRLQQPIDCGWTMRGRRLFGDNKTVRGFVVMVPATALAFVGWSAVWTPWPLSPLQLAGLGALAGLGFMLGELPNSALKRQLDVPPGQAPKQLAWQKLSLLLDRTDSLLGSLLTVHLLAGVPALAWVVCLVVGPAVHALFSFLLYRGGVKRRAL